MKLQRTTWILLAIALGLGGFVYLSEIQGASKREAAREQQQKIFSLAEDRVESLTIERPTQTLQFERTGKEEQPWQMKRPEDVPASEASVAFLLNLLVEGNRDRAIAISSNQLEEYGLAQPFATITVRVKDREQPHKIILGKPNFDEKFLYARVDPSSQTEKTLEMVLVPIDFKYAIERDLQEWKQGSEKRDRDK
jgi:Domain of unknown function (DUF4340)